MCKKVRANMLEINGTYTTVQNVGVRLNKQTKKTQKKLLSKVTVNINNFGRTVSDRSYSFILLFGNKTNKSIIFLIKTLLTFQYDISASERVCSVDLSVQLIIL